MLNFCVIFTNSRIYGVSLDFSEAKYDREWLMCDITVS